MRSKTLTFLVCFATAFLLNVQFTDAQDLTKFLTPGGGVSPEAQKSLRESSEFKTLTPEQIERGKAELEKRERESRREEQERVEREKKEEKEAKKADELSQQEKELRYIANKYKDRTIRNIGLLSDSFIKDQSSKQDIRQNLEKLDLQLIDAFDQYQEDVIGDIVSRFQFRSAMYRDSTMRLREIFS